MAVPTGLSGAAAISLVQQYSDETTLPAASQILTFLNRGVEEVERRIGGIHLTAPYYTIANQPIIVLNNDVLEVESANFSMGNAASTSVGNSSPFVQGTLVYPMSKLSQAQFYDAAAGFPTVGFGPPQAYFIYQDAGQDPSTTLPAPGVSPMPTQPTLSTTTGTSDGTIQYIQITYTNAAGETTGSGAQSLTPTTVQQTLVNSPPSYSNATGYNVYGSATVGGTYYLQNTAGAIALGTNYTVPGTLIATGTVLPTTNTATGVGQGGILSMQLYPAAMIGQVNIYYRARPQLWSSATSGLDYTNLDSSAQEAVVLFAVMRVLQNRGRGAEAMQSWKPEYEAMIADLKESMNRRVYPPSGQVRDIRNRSYPSAPWWMTS